MPPTKHAIAFASELLAAYPGRSTSAASVKAIAEALDAIGLERADDVCSLLRLRCSYPPSVAEVFQVGREVAGDIPLSGDWDTFRCHYSDTRECPQCHEIHGHLLTPDTVAHGLFHLHELMALPKAERTDEMRQIAQYPERCSCDNRAESKDPAAVVRELSERYG